MNKQPHFKITHHGAPSIKDLPKSEQDVFFSTLFNTILTIKQTTQGGNAYGDRERKSI